MCVNQGCKFSDYNLISDFFTLTPLKIVSKISLLERISQGFLIDSDFQKRSFVIFQTFTMDPTYIPGKRTHIEDTFSS